MKRRHSGNFSFSRVPDVKIERSTFDRSHTVKTAFDEAYLVPIYADEVLPGDTFKLNMSAFCRLATPLKPFMDNVYLESFFFAVPYRLLWNNWQKFCGEQDDPGDSTDFVLPYFKMSYVTDINIETGDLGDYLGLPIIDHAEYQTGEQHIVSLWHRAYNLIWNEWFRDENLQDKVVVDKGDGPDTYANYKTLLKRGKRHDYFTSCLPWPQKSDDITLPMGEFNDVLWVHGFGEATGQTGSTGSRNVMEADGNTVTYTDTIAGSYYFEGVVGGATIRPTLSVDMTDLVAGTINELRQATQLQRLYERDARGGTRYTEIVRSHFGVVSPDARLQRPEYLGGGVSRMNIHPLAQTSATGATGTPQGNLAAFGTGSINGHGFSKSFTEHCVLIGMVNVRADISYQEGLNRMFSRATRFDMYWPALAHLGEQAVLNKEILFTYTDTTVDHLGNNDVFGYQERYAEYRYKINTITGKMRSQIDTGSLDVWHLAQEFGNMPTLSPEFIVDAPPFNRVVVSQTEPHFLFDAFIDLKCTRPIPLYSIPGLMDHF